MRYTSKTQRWWCELSFLFFSVIIHIVIGVVILPELTEGELCWQKIGEVIIKLKKKKKKKNRMREREKREG